MSEKREMFQVAVSLTDNGYISISQEQDQYDAEILLNIDQVQTLIDWLNEVVEEARR